MIHPLNRNRGISAPLVDHRLGLLPANIRMNRNPPDVMAGARSLNLLAAKSHVSPISWRSSVVPPPSH